ncbi:MAG: hypothetical protein R2857_15860 [Vampirovibrionales bacterium]
MVTTALCRLQPPLEQTGWLISLWTVVCFVHQELLGLIVLPVLGAIAMPVHCCPNPL